MIHPFRNIILLVFFSWASVIVAQEPSHYFLGSQELSGMDVYDIHQDDELNYWIATHKGLIKYDGYEFVPIELDGASSVSVFYLTSDLEDNLYCYNLSGQIFQIKNDLGSVYYQIPDTMMTSYLAYEFDNQGVLTINSRYIFQVVDNELKVIHPEKNDSLHSYGLFKTKDGTLQTYSVRKQCLLSIKDGQCTEIEVKISPELKGPIRFYTIGDGHVAINSGKSEIVRELSVGLNDDLGDDWVNAVSFGDRFHFDESFCWLAKSTGGMTLYDPKNRSSVAGRFFKDHIISAFFVDNEGNRLFGTFDNGIIVVPNYQISNLSFPDEVNKATYLCEGPDQTIFIGFQNGSVYQYFDDGTKSFFFKGPRAIEIINYLPTTNEILINGSGVSAIDVESGAVRVIDMGVPKRLRTAGEYGYILTTSQGVRSIDADGNLHQITELNVRSNRAAVEEDEGIIYASTTKGFKIGKGGEFKSFSLNGEKIQVNDVLYFNSRVYVATTGNGVLVFDNGELIEEVDRLESWPIEDVYQMEKENGFLYLSTDAGIFETNDMHELLREVSVSSGLSTNATIDFEIIGDVVWVINSGGVQRVPIKEISEKAFRPELSISSLLVNQSEVEFSKTEFEYTEDRFLFALDASSIRYRDGIRYEYMLSGIDDDWQSRTYDDRMVEYKSLPPGDYVFKARAYYRNEQSNEIVYQFTIAAPFWRTYWFIGLCFVVIVCVAYLLYRFQLSRQRKKSEFQKELIASKLVAIQSQMNPHFIFNSLNSIQDLVLQKDDKNAYNYINKFATLVRKVLHQSSQDMIEIEEELAILEVYLELEKLRFKDDFSFKIIESDLPDLEIPPLIIQPFVENAIKHGLLHKKGEKLLTVQFVMKDKKLLCVIEDNGIGRKKSEEIRERQSRQHDSFSIKSVENRFEILEKIYPGELGLEIEDVYVDKEDTGTKVVLTIPFKRKF